MIPDHRASGRLCRNEGGHHAAPAQVYRTTSSRQRVNILATSLQFFSNGETWLHRSSERRLLRPRNDPQRPQPGHEPVPHHLREKHDRHNKAAQQYLHLSFDAAADWIEFYASNWPSESAPHRAGAGGGRGHPTARYVGHRARTTSGMSKDSTGEQILWEEASEREHRFAKGLEQGQCMANDASYDGVARYLFQQMVLRASDFK